MVFNTLNTSPTPSCPWTDRFIVEFACYNKNTKFTLDKQKQTLYIYHEIIQCLFFVEIEEIYVPTTTSRRKAP